MDRRGKSFAPGNRFGKGRQAGSRNNVTLACDELMDGEGAAITQKVIEMAKAGYRTAIRLCMDRLYPPRREGRLKMGIAGYDHRQ